MCAGGQLARLNRTERLVVLYDSPSIDLHVRLALLPSAIGARAVSAAQHPPGRAPPTDASALLSSPTHTCGSEQRYTRVEGMGTGGCIALGLGSHRQPCVRPHARAHNSPCVHRLDSHGHDHVRPRGLLVQTRRRARACAAAALTLTRGNVPRHGQRATWRALVNENAADAVEPTAHAA